MVNISKFGDSAIKFTFTDNDHYLFNGEIEVPINSLLLVLDESDMVTFKKIDGDPFVSFLIGNSNFASKSDLEDFYKTNMVGSMGGGSQSGVTSGEVQTMIDTSLEDYYDKDEVDAAVSGKADSSAVTQEISAAVSGKADSSSVYTKSEVDAALNDKADSSAVTQEISAAVSGKADSSAVTEAITAAVSGKADSSSVYTKSEVDAALDDKADSSAVTEAITAAVSGKADSSAVYTKSEVDTALSGKQDVSGMTAYTTSSDVESYVSGFTYNKATIDSKVASGGTFDPTNYYDKTATDALLDDKFDASAFTSYSAATNARLAEDEEVTAAAFNDLNEALSGKANSSAVTQEISAAVSGKADSSAVTEAITAAVSGKQDTLIAGDGIDITNDVISVIGKVDTSAFSTYSAATDARLAEDEEVTAAALNALDEALSGKADASAVTEALSGKQDTLIAGTNITINGNVISAESDNNVIELTQAQYDALTDKDPDAFYIITDAVGVSVTSSVTINSTDVITSGGVYAALNGLKLVKITAADYALITPDDNTVYFVGDSNGYSIKIGNVNVN